MSPIASMARFRAFILIFSLGVVAFLIISYYLSMRKKITRLEIRNLKLRSKIDILVSQMKDNHRDDVHVAHEHQVDLEQSARDIRILDDKYKQLQQQLTSLSNEKQISNAEECVPPSVLEKCENSSRLLKGQYDQLLATSKKNANT
jgi:hypothetical protein